MQVMRHVDCLDLQSFPSRGHCDLLLKLAEVSHPNLVRILMVYAIIYERVTEKRGVLGCTPMAKLPQLTGIPPKQGKFG